MSLNENNGALLENTNNVVTIYILVGMHSVFYQHDSVNSFDNLSPSMAQLLLEVLSIVDVSELFVKATYLIEDGPLVSAYEDIRVLLSSILPQCDSSDKLAGGVASLTNQFITMPRYMCTAASI